MFLLLFAGWGIILKAQEDTRPKVGVVLSGGGGKGLAHIGVLQVLEDMGIPVDYVAGTSIGAIVGGFYACGYDAYQLDSIVSSYNLRDVLLGSTPRYSKGIRERIYNEKTFIGLTMNRGKINIPLALTGGQQLYDFLYSNTFPENMTDCFDSLPRPFFCIGTDLITGNEVYLGYGNLASAMKASCALPTIMTPVRYDDYLLVDGGVVNNIPIQEMRSFGADIVIAVSVESGLLDEEELLSAADVLAQVNSYSMVSRSRQQYKYADVLISPDIQDFGLLDFDDPKALIEIGKAGTYKVMDSLVAIAARLRKYDTPDKLKKNKFKKYFKINKLLIDAEEEDVGYVLSHLPFVEGDYISMDDICNALNTL